jgi:HEPN domain-containing protein
MLPDEARRGDTRAWLAKARTDLRSAEHALAASPPLLEDVLFHCQQTIEKAMKGLLVWHDVPFRKTHSLEELGRQCVAIEPTLEPLADRVSPLSEYAWRFRYPDEQDSPAREEAEAALGAARAALAAIADCLPSAIGE